MEEKETKVAIQLRGTHMYIQYVHVNTYTCNRICKYTPRETFGRRFDYTVSKW